MTESNGYSCEDWQKHYDSGDMPWDLGEVAAPFRVMWEEGALEPGTMMVPGCGRGHEVFYFASNGFDVTAVDYAPGAVANLRQNLSAYGNQVRVFHQNFFDLDESHHCRYDWMLEHTFFCAIHPNDREHYVRVAEKIIKPGGVLFGLFYETGEDGGPPFNTGEQDILHHFGSGFAVKRLEKCETSSEKRKGKEWWAFLQKR